MFAARASQRSRNQSGPAIPSTADKTLSTKPSSPISIQWNDTKAGMDGSAQGRM